MRLIVAMVGVLAVGCTDTDPPDEQQPSGAGETVGTDTSEGPFFTALGTNQRTCATCHDRDAGWSITPASMQALFDSTGGMDPVFRLVDGAVAPTADASTEASRRTAYQLLLDRGVIRVGRAIPAGADFTLSSTTDPAGFASATELSLFRRPLPATNLRFLSSIMWDEREPSLAMQASDATVGHAQAMGIPAADVIDQIVAFESATYSAQRTDDLAGDLAADGARGGATALADQAFTVGVNDIDAASFDRDVFSIYDAWRGADASTAQGRRRAQIARGEQIFNTERIDIRGVAGLSDRRGTCSTCHDTPNVGSHSLAVPMDIGIGDDDRRPDGFPLYTLTHTTDGRTVRTTDPGYALTTGKWADVGRFKVPSLRGLARRPPYFHNGMADNLNDVVRFYIRRFGMRLSDDEQADLVAFLSSL